jgi:hypothetical protein
MNQHLINHIDAKIAQASRFVTQYMPLDINTDNAYEAMLECSNNHTPEMIEAFKVAVKYLPPAANHKTFNLMMADGRLVSVQVKFLPTVKWPTFLIPEGNLSINPEGEFAAQLDTPIRVATEWESLAYLWKELSSDVYGLEPYVLAYLMPWIRECLADFDNAYLPVNVTRHERKAIDKEVSRVMNDWNVLYFPRLSKRLNAVARSGRHLFGQYKLIESAYHRESLVQSPVTITRTPSLIEPWMREHMAEMRNEWDIDRAARYQRETDAIVVKAAKRFDQLNPKGK